MNKGFTFVEIMIVIVIIGLLLGIALPNYTEGRSKAMTITCQSNQKIIYTAATMYMLAETESLAGMGDKEKLDALIAGGYLKGSKCAECPSSGDNSFDDYEIIIEDNIAVDVECKVKLAEHEWP